MPGTPTTKYAIPTLAGTDLARDIDTLVTSALTSIDSKMVGYSEGTLASRPVSSGGSPGVVGRIYKSTDEGRVYIDNGTGWDEVRSSTAKTRGKSIISAEETRSTTSYGTLTTPDRVSGIVLPANGLIFVHYHAMAKNASGGTTGQYAIFLGANQLKTKGSSGATVPGVQEGNINGSATTFYGLIGTNGVGVQNGAQTGADYTGDVTTGQIVAGLSNISGGPVAIFAAAGTYDITIQFKAAASNTISVKNRNLWVWTELF